MRHANKNESKLAAWGGALLDTNELAALLNVSPNTIRKWRHTEQIKAVKIGKKLVRYRWEDIAHLVCHPSP